MSKAKANTRTESSKAADTRKARTTAAIAGYLSCQRRRIVGPGLEAGNGH